VYLYGLYVDPINYKSDSGYLIVREDSSITINGRIYQTLKGSSFRPAESWLFPDKPHPDNFEEAIRRIINYTKVISDTEVVLEGVSVTTGDTFTYELPDRDYQVMGTYRRKEYRLWDDDSPGAGIPAQRYFPSESYHVRYFRTLNSKYETARLYVLTDHIVLLGRHYQDHYPIEQSERVMATIQRIPSMVPLMTREEIADKFKNDGFNWSYDLISDFSQLPAR